MKTLGAGIVSLCRTLWRRAPTFRVSTGCEARMQRPSRVRGDVQVELDAAVVQWLHGATMRTLWLATGATVVAEYGVFLLPIALLIIWCTSDRGSAASRRKAIIVGCLAAVLAAVTGLALEHVLGRPRPFAALGFSPLIEHAADSSVP